MVVRILERGYIGLLEFWFDREFGICFWNENYFRKMYCIFIFKIYVWFIFIVYVYILSMWFILLFMLIKVYVCGLYLYFMFIFRICGFFYSLCFYIKYVVYLIVCVYILSMWFIL